MEQNKRKFTRVNFVSHAHIVVNGESYEGEVLDLSIRGVLLEFEEMPPVKTEETIMLNILFDASGLKLSTKAQAARIDGSRIGFKFMSIDIDTMTHLRRIIELNCGDPDKVADELNQFF